MIRRLARSEPDARPERILLTAEDRQRLIVTGRCVASARDGVQPGMTVAQARALLPSRHVHAEPDRPARDEASLTALAHHALRYSPVVAADPPDGLLLDVAGCSHLFGGEAAHARAILDGMSRLGFNARIAIAPTFACAWAFARFAGSSQTIVRDGGEREAMSPLPIDALRIDAATHSALAEIGVETVGQLLELPRRETAARYGSELLLALDRALGTAIEVIDPVRPPDDRFVERAFAGPVTQTEAIEIATRETLDELCALLERQGRGVRTLDLRLLRIDTHPIDLRITLSRATRDARHLWSLLAPRVERVSLGYGVESLTITAARTARLAHAQGGLTDGDRGSEAWISGAQSRGAQRAVGELIDTLINRLGGQRVLRVDPVESHRPERAFRWRPAAEASNPATAAVTGSERPSILFERPEPVRVLAMSPDGPLARIEWRGEALGIRQCLGPERISREWWRDDARPSGDWFAVEDESGRWLWVLREPGAGDLPAAWFVHGVWA